MYEDAVRDLIEMLDETADFLKRLNHYWSEELKTLAGEAGEFLNNPNKKDYEEFFKKIEFVLFGKNQLGELFVSAPAKREKFRVYINHLKENYRTLKTAVS